MKPFLLHQQAGLHALRQRTGLQGGGYPPDNNERIWIQWDRYLSFPLNGLVLNPTLAVEQVTNESVQEAVLRLHGIPVAKKNSKARFIRWYYIPLFHFSALGVYQFQQPVVGRRSLDVHLSSKGKLLTKEGYTKEVYKAVRLGVRALYATGLDFAGILIGVRSTGGLYVLDIHATPKVNQQMMQQYFLYFQRFRLSDVSSKMSLGADIEFLLQDAKGRLVPASQFFAYRGSVGYDAARDPEHREHHPIVELRPKPSHHPKQLYRNVFRAIKHVESRTGHRYAWLAGNMPVNAFPIGGHLHFGQAPLNFHVIRVLDEYLAFPFRMLESPQGAIKRRPRYGRLGDVRKKWYGYEYRTLPSFIYTPRITLAVFALAQFLLQHYTKLSISDSCRLEVLRDYYQGNGAELYPLIEQKLVAVESLPAYPQVEPLISPLFIRIRSGQPFDDKQDVHPAWKVRHSSNLERLSKNI